MITTLLNKFFGKINLHTLRILMTGILVITQSTLVAQCDVEVQMYDSFGDGWNGGSLEIFFDGISQGTFAASGSGSTANLTIPAGETMTINYTSGNWENENTYNIAVNGTITFSDGPDPTTGLVYSYNCCNTPGAPTANDVSLSCGNTAILNASGAPSGGDYIWYSDINGSNQVGTGSTFTSPNLSTNTTYYVSATTSSLGSSQTFTATETSQTCNSGGCDLTFTINNAPSNPISSATIEVFYRGDFGASSENFNVIGEGTSVGTSTGNFECDANYNSESFSVSQALITNWANDGTITIVLDASNAVNFCSDFFDAYIVVSYDYEGLGGVCESSLTPVNITVTPLAPPIPNGTFSVCEGQSTQLDVISNDSVYWYSDANGTNLIGSGNSFTTPVLNMDTTYYTQSTNGNSSTNTASLNTTFAGGNGQNGNMFDINVLNSITINDFDVNANNGTGDFEVYYKAGSYNGFETNVGAWTLVGTATNVTSNGQGTPTPLNLNLNLQLTPGSYSFYITGTNTGVQYTNGTNNNNIYAQNNEIELFEGLGKEYPFGATYSPRIWNGVIHYEVGTIASCLSTITPITVNVNTPPIAPVISGNSTACYGENVTLTGAGGNASPANWTWYENNVNGPQLGNGAITTVSPSNTTDYLVEVAGNGGCPPAVSNTITVSLPTPDNTIAENNAQATCRVAQNGFVHFLDANGKLIVSINSNGQNLGQVSATSYVEGSPLQVADCSSSILTSVLDRHWVITPEFQPSGPVDIRLPMTQQEEQSLVIEANGNSNPNDDLTGLGETVLTKYAGPTNVDNLFSNNCTSQGGNETFDLYTQTTSGFVSDYWPLYGGQDLYASYSINGFSEFWLHGTNNNSPLPVMLSHFNSTCENGGTKLSWETASEQNSSHFNVQRSRDGYNWETVNTVGAAGNSTSLSSYEVFDDAVSGETVYYRLQQVDIDGKEELFGPISSSCDFEENAMIVYPNPSNDNFNVRFTSTSNVDGAFLQIADLNGRTVIKRAISINTGQSVFSFTNTKLRPGTYIIYVIGSEEKFSRQILVVQ